MEGSSLDEWFALRSGYLGYQVLDDFLFWQAKDFSGEVFTRGCIMKPVEKLCTHHSWLFNQVR